MIGPEAEEITKEGVEIFLTVKIRATFTGFYWNFFMDLSVDTKDNSFLSHDYTKNFFITISCGAANQTEECMTTIGSGE